MKKSTFKTMTLLAGSVLLASAAFAGGGGASHWARTTPTFKLRVIDSVTSTWDTQLRTALQEWSYSEVVDLAIYSSSDTTTSTRLNCPMAAGSIRVCNYSYGVNGWMGLSVFGMDSTGHVDRGAAMLNDSYSAHWNYYPSLRNHVMCHELGHLLGLEHSSEDGSSQQTCMDYSTSSNSQWPNGTDYDMLLDIYAHLDTYNSYAGAPLVSGTTTTTTPTTTSTPPATVTACKGNKKHCGAAAFVAPAKPTRIKAGRFEEVWVSPRNDGGVWIHHYYLGPQTPAL